MPTTITILGVSDAATSELVFAPTFVAGDLKVEIAGVVTNAVNLPTARSATSTLVDWVATDAEYVLGAEFRFAALDGSWIGPTLWVVEAEDCGGIGPDDILAITSALARPTWLNALPVRPGCLGFDSGRCV